MTEVGCWFGRARLGIGSLEQRQVEVVRRENASGDFQFLIGGIIVTDKRASIGI